MSVWRQDVSFVTDNVQSFVSTKGDIPAHSESGVEFRDKGLVVCGTHWVLRECGKEGRKGRVLGGKKGSQSGTHLGPGASLHRVQQALPVVTSLVT